MGKVKLFEPDWATIKIAIVAAKWNSFVTDEMLNSAIEVLRSKGLKENNIEYVRCPGSFELPLACQWFAEQEHISGVIAIGAVIRGGTPHFDYVCDAVTRGITDLNSSSGVPISFGVLTTDTVEQAMERANADKGNKGAEAALALCEMITIKNSIEQNSD